MSLVQGELSARLFCLVYPMLSGPVLFSVCGMLLGYQSPVCRYCILSFSSLPLLGFVTAAPCLSFIASGDVQCSVQPSWWGPGPCVTFMLIVLGCRSFVFYSFLDENTPQEQPRWASGQGRACGVSRGSPVMSRAHSQHAGPRGSASTASQDTPIFKPRWAKQRGRDKGSSRKAGEQETAESSMEPRWRPPTPQGQACEEVRAEADSTSASGAQPCSVCGHVASLGSQSASEGAGFDLESTGWWMGSGKCTLIAALQTVPVPQPSP